MSQFRLLKQTRQMTEYSCGASALQSVLSHWGREIEEEALMRLLGTNPEVGTFPADMVRGARALGFDAVSKENATLEEVERFTASGHPVIALAQLWRSEKDTTESAADEWDCGHYIVVLAVDADYVYFQDPYIRMGKGFVPRSAFDEHWHQIMGGAELARSEKLHHVAIFIKGTESALPPGTDQTDVSTLDLSRLGSISAVSIRFPKFLLPFDFLDELRQLFDDGLVRPVAFALLRKDSEGKVSGMQGGRLEDGEDVVAVNALIAALAAHRRGATAEMRTSAMAAVREAAAGDFGLSAEDLRRRAERLRPGHSEVIVLLENRWETRFRDATRRYGGTIAEEMVISTAALAEMGKRLVPSAG